MTTDELGNELQRLYWADVDLRCASGTNPSEGETLAANAYLPTLAHYTARAAARWAKRAHRPRRFQPPYVAEHVAIEARELMQAEKGSDKDCGIVLSAVGWLLLRSLLENLAWRFALWLFSDPAEEDRSELICKMEG
jgi:hypothetical protein